MLIIVLTWYTMYVLTGGQGIARHIQPRARFITRNNPQHSPRTSTCTHCCNNTHNTDGKSRKVFLTNPNEQACLSFPSPHPLSPPSSYIIPEALSVTFQHL